ncbi:hypothetical protein BTO05_03630 [Winogradskyella sp. PC-19]|uniref:DUF2490 domain-containing protein n=1 Tax=unclassified Winogradskyella TaxID=2615021 RepID=UPI000B3D372A|nr:MULTISPECIES: DUF2490 domain-containing protein [unclassified Winogradskyella]ARV08770.1 hypothetical protein BTO05_03630 [Winogradskyella sp. PC-19]
MRFILLLVFCFATFLSIAQVDQSQTGAWYMYFFTHQLKDSQFGIQGDFQYRDWQGLGDKEQLLLRSGFTYTPKETSIKFTLGYANITSGVPGANNDTSNESRIYQEALFSSKFGRFLLTHRFRYEQRFVENQDFRTRYRYNLFLNIPINNKALSPKTIYAALYNELFINGQQEIGDGREVELFDRNRTYLGLGYVINSNIRFQFGWMNQKTNTWGKGQLQFSMHHKL